MSFYGIAEEEALTMDIATYRKRMTDAIKLGNFQAGGGLDLIDNELKINTEYEEFTRNWIKANQ